MRQNKFDKTIKSCGLRHLRRVLFLIIIVTQVTPHALAQVSAIADTVVVGINDTIVVPVARNDTSNTGLLTVTGLEASATLGAIEITEDSTGVRYVAPEDFEGEDAFGYTVADASGADASSTVTLNVAPGLSVDFDTIALYKNDDVDSTRMADASPSGADGVAFGPAPNNGPLGGMRCFDGVDDYANMDAVIAEAQGLESFTIEYVVQQAANGSAPALINHSFSGGWVLIGRHSSAVYGLKLTSTGQTWVDQAWHSASFDGQQDSLWHYFALTWTSSDSIRVYRNGVFVGGRGSPGGTMSSSGNLGANIGRDDFVNAHYPGCADEIRFSGTQHSAEQIRNTWWHIKEQLGHPSGVAVEPGRQTLDLARVDVFPNPFANRLSILLHEQRQGGVVAETATSNETIRVTVFDLLGRQRLERVFPGTDANSPLTFATDFLPRGTYLIRIERGRDAQVRIVTRH